MRINNPIFKATFIASEALAAHRLVIENATDGQVEYPAGEADTQHLGITLHEAAAGEQVDVCMFGPCILTVDGTAASGIARGGWLVSHDGEGRGQNQAIADGTAAHELIGYALEASTADGDEIAVWFQKQLAFLT